MPIGYPLVLFLYLFKGFRIQMTQIWDMAYQTLFRDIEKWGCGIFQGLRLVYIISLCTKSRMLLSMLHGPGRLFRDTGIWISGIFFESTINEALDVYLGIQGYSAFLKGYGIVTYSN